MAKEGGQTASINLTLEAGKTAITARLGRLPTMTAAFSEKIFQVFRIWIYGKNCIRVHDRYKLCCKGIPTQVLLAQMVLENTIDVAILCKLYNIVGAFNPQNNCSATVFPGNEINSSIYGKYVCILFLNQLTLNFNPLNSRATIFNLTNFLLWFARSLRRRVLTSMLIPIIPSTLSDASKI